MRQKLGSGFFCTMSLRYYLAWVSIVAAGITALYILKKELVEESLSALMDFRDIKEFRFSTVV